MRKRIILSGNAGSGKTTVGKLISELTGVPFISAGQIIREKMKAMNLDIIQFQDYCKVHPETDIEIDNALVQKLSGMDAFIADYRLGFHFFPDAWSVLLKVSDSIAFNRIGERVNTEENLSELSSIERLNIIQLRNSKMRDRFIKIYNQDYLEESNYDMVINTDSLAPEIIARTILSK